MAYRTRSARRVANKSKNRFFATIIISGLLLYFGIFWALPNLIGGIGLLNKSTKPTAQSNDNPQNSSFAPPVLNIPFEATNTAQIDLHGYSTPNSKVNIYIDDQLKVTSPVAEDGSFTALSVDLNLGVNNIYGKTVDDKNQESLASKTFQLTYDNQKPSLDISSPTDGQVIHGDKKITIQGKTDPGDTLMINGSQIIINNDGSFSKDYPLGDGDNSFNFKSFDKASNLTEITRKVTYQQ